MAEPLKFEVGPVAQEVMRYTASGLTILWTDDPAGTILPSYHGFVMAGRGTPIDQIESEMRKAFAPKEEIA